MRSDSLPYLPLLAPRSIITRRVYRQRLTVQAADEQLARWKNVVNELADQVLSLAVIPLLPVRDAVLRMLRRL